LFIHNFSDRQHQEGEEQGRVKKSNFHFFKICMTGFCYTALLRFRFPLCQIAYLLNNIFFDFYSSN
jgi:hypothetical protein